MKDVMLVMAMTSLIITSFDMFDPHFEVVGTLFVASTIVAASWFFSDLVVFVGQH